MVKLNNKTRLIFQILLFLVLALILSSYVLGTTFYARYVTTASGGDGARVARFSFDEDLSDQALDLSLLLSPGEHEDYSITIENDGEVTLQCTVKIVNLTNNLPIDDQVITSEEIAMGETSTFDWRIEWPEGDNSVEFMGKLDVIRIIVTVEQVD